MLAGILHSNQKLKLRTWPGDVLASLPHSLPCPSIPLTRLRLSSEWGPIYHLTCPVASLKNRPERKGEQVSSCVHHN